MRRIGPIAQGGFTLVEVLVTMIILAIGLLGLAGLQARIHVLQMESYQRAQALVLLKDMADRIAANRNYAGAYATAAPAPHGVGTDSTSCAASGSTRAAQDISDWCNALQGASETASGSSVGSLVGGRGCVESLGNGLYLVTVAWQGLAPISAPPSGSNGTFGVDCGLNLYNGGTGSSCTGDLCRRTVTTLVTISTLSS